MLSTNHEYQADDSPLQHRVCLPDRFTTTQAKQFDLTHVHCQPSQQKGPRLTFDRLIIASSTSKMVKCMAHWKSEKYLL